MQGGGVAGSGGDGVVAVQGGPGEEQESGFDLYESRCMNVCGDVMQSTFRNCDFSWLSEVELFEFDDLGKIKIKQKRRKVSFAWGCVLLLTSHR